MRAIFSSELWLIFGERIVNAVFPTVIVLLFFAWAGRKSFTQGSPMRFFLVFLFVEAAVRLFVFFAGVPYQGRYLYSIAVLMLIIGAAGLPAASELLGGIFKRIPLLRKINPLAALIIILSAAHLGKALHHTESKQWLGEIPTAIMKACPPGQKPVVISSIDDLRLAYYSKGEFLLATHPDSKEEMIEGCALLVKNPVSGELARTAAAQGRPFMLEDENGGSEFYVLIPPVFAETSYRGPPEFKEHFSSPDEIGEKWRKLYNLKYKGMEKIRLPHGMLALSGPWDCGVEISGVSRETGEWESLFKGRLSSFKNIFFRREFYNVIKVRISSPGELRSGKTEAPDAGRLKPPPPEVRIRNSTWHIWEMGTGGAVGKWLVRHCPGRLESFKAAVEKMGGDNVFLLLDLGDEEFKAMHEREKTPFTFRKLGVFKIGKNCSATLYQGAGE